MVLKQISSFTFRTSTQGCLWLSCSQASTWPEINGKRTYMSVKNNAQGVSHVKDMLLSLFSVQFSGSVVSDSLQPHESQHARPPCPSPTPCPSPSLSSLRLTSIELVMPSNHLIFYCPLLLLASIFSGISVFSNESVLMRWMNLEPIIQSEVSQKEKDKYHILMHIYGI